MSAVITHAMDTWRHIRAEFQDLLEARYAAAENALGPALLNRRGWEAGIDPMSLFYGPRTRVDAYASRELLDWFAEHGRTTYTEFETQYLEAMIDPGRDTTIQEADPWSLAR
ncbi:hypothetical protein [Isoptericola croceus]|uniref:hypothetical protein n=1 Tax=Isoptericola croceus TaxID=3031406 RepID=UPI0023FA43FC|nr:hypothetical protein [Isoptericola croceus]